MVYVATADTRHYEWHGIGTTRDEAVAALLRAWQRHCRETDTDPAGLHADEINVLCGQPGAGFRDRREMRPPS